MGKRVLPGVPPPSEGGRKSDRGCEPPEQLETGHLFLMCRLAENSYGILSHQVAPALEPEDSMDCGSGGASKALPCKWD